MKELVILLMLVVILFCVIGIYSARSIVRRRIKLNDENGAVTSFKIVCYIFIIFAIFALIYIK